MTSELTLLTVADATAVYTQSADRVRIYLDSARARNTIRGYRSSFQQFTAWCGPAGMSPLPASQETIAQYIAAQAGRLKASTLQHHLAAISKAHKTAGFPSPVKDNALIAETLKGIKRTHGTAPCQKAPVLTEDLRMMLRSLPKNLLGIRDRVLLLIGFAGAFRRSELVSLDISHLTFSAEGLLINLVRSKTDQEGEGRSVGIPHGNHPETCPVRALQAWLAVSAITAGAIFRPVDRHGRISPNRLSDHSVGLIVKRYAAAIGLPVGSFSGHSLRAGFVTSAARAGEPERRIMRQTGHRSIEMVLRYVRQANLFTDNAALALGL
ncbi:MAG: site-specific integrase [Acidobacteriota bacterium]|nr:site-specific integrase [Acidobacteriota bacterium]